MDNGYWKCLKRASINHESMDFNKYFDQLEFENEDIQNSMVSKSVVFSCDVKAAKAESGKTAVCGSFSEKTDKSPSTQFEISFNLSNPKCFDSNTNAKFNRQIQKTYIHELFHRAISVRRDATDDQTAKAQVIFDRDIHSACDDDGKIEACIKSDKLYFEIVNSCLKSEKTCGELKNKSLGNDPKVLKLEKNCIRSDATCHEKSKKYFAIECNRPKIFSTVGQTTQIMNEIASETAADNPAFAAAAVGAHLDTLGTNEDRRPAGGESSVITGDSINAASIFNSNQLASLLGSARNMADTALPDGKLQVLASSIDKFVAQVSPRVQTFLNTIESPAFANNPTTAPIQKGDQNVNASNGINAKNNYIPNESGKSSAAGNVMTKNTETARTAKTAQSGKAAGTGKKSLNGDDTAIANAKSDTATRVAPDDDEPAQRNIASEKTTSGNATSAARFDDQIRTTPSKELSKTFKTDKNLQTLAISQGYQLIFKDYTFPPDDKSKPKKFKKTFLCTSDDKPCAPIKGKN